MPVHGRFGSAVLRRPRSKPGEGDGRRALKPHDLSGLHDDRITILRAGDEVDAVFIPTAAVRRAC